MSKFRVYKYLTYNKHKVLKALLLFVVIFLAIVPAILLFTLFSQGTSMEFTLEYLNQDENFVDIDYSGIECEFEAQTHLKYWLDGQLFVTSSGTIKLFFNNYNEHNLTLYFSGETYEYIFNSSITETIQLACKSINTTILWEDIEVPIEGFSITLQYWSGTDWYDIQVDVSDVNGLVSFYGLICGLYRLGTIEFTLNQSTTTYTTENIYVVADKTIIDIDYLNTIFGANYPFDLSGITWDIQIELSIWASIVDGHYTGMIVDDVAGTITIYNLMNGYNYRFCVFDYAGVNSTYDIVLDGFTQVNLLAKNLIAEFTWSGDSVPAVGIEVELFWFDGTEFVSAGTYITDVNGKVILINMLPIGTYMFEGQAEFSITASDITKTVVYTVESLCGKEKECFSLGFYRDIESKLFFFFVFKLKIKLIIVFPELWQIDLCLLGTSTTISLHLATAQFTLLKGGIKQ